MNSHAMSANNSSGLPQVSDRLAFNAMRNWKERLIEAILLGAAAISVLTTLGIVYVLVSESINFFSSVVFPVPLHAAKASNGIIVFPAIGQAPLAYSR